MTPGPTAPNLATAARLQTEAGTVTAGPKNAQRNEASKIVGHFVGQIPASPSAANELQENAQRNAGGNAQQKAVGQIVEKSPGKSRNAQRLSAGRTEWFRYEMDFRPRKKVGHQVVIRRRLKWSSTRYAPTVASCVCADLTERMVKNINDGKFTAAAVAALQNGGMSHEIVKNLAERIGKGNGKRSAELTEHERSVLARIESGLAAGGRRRNASA